MTHRAGARPVPLAIVHHANQHLITDGYDNRQGIGDIVSAFTELLGLHERYGVPASLHLSGTFVEAVAWHSPGFLDLVRRLVDAELVEIVGGTYGEDIMPLFPADVNRRQLEEGFRVYEELLGYPAERIRTFWVPERVWDTEALAPVLTDPSLPNGGYTAVLLDDRLLFPVGASYPGSPRAAFDAAGPYGSLLDSIPDRDAVPLPPPIAEWSRTYRISGGRGLAVAPISADLRYWVPPRTVVDLQRLNERIGALADLPDGHIVVYADDMEKTAGVAGWESALDRFEGLLRWLVDRSPRVAPIRLDDWLGSNPPAEERSIERGTFFELAVGWGAGEDYLTWWESPNWSPFRNQLAEAEAAVRRLELEGGEPELASLAWKHFLASTHETGWRDLEEDGTGRAAAPWARAMASHSRSCLVMVAAAAPARPPAAHVVDLDNDGEVEVAMRTRDTFAVLTPGRGGRLVYLFVRGVDGHRLVLGNPTDHWNFQEELNRFMDRPPNHPGGLADVGFEHDRFAVTATQDGPDGAVVELEDITERSPLRGARKRVVLLASDPVLAACYRLPETMDELETEVCLSPDYGLLLRSGRREVRAVGETIWKGFAAGETRAWVAIDPAEGSAWSEPRFQEVGHGLMLQVRAASKHFHVLVGTGDTDEERCRSLLARGADVAHRTLTPAGSGKSNDLEVRA